MWNLPVNAAHCGHLHACMQKSGKAAAVCGMRHGRAYKTSYSRQGHSQQHATARAHNSRQDLLQHAGLETAGRASNSRQGQLQKAGGQPGTRDLPKCALPPPCRPCPNSHKSPATVHLRRLCARRRHRRKGRMRAPPLEPPSTGHPATQRRRRRRCTCAQARYPQLTGTPFTQRTAIIRASPPAFVGPQAMNHCCAAFTDSCVRTGVDVECTGVVVERILLCLLL